MMTTFRTLFTHLWITSAFLALAFDPMGVVYEVAHLDRRAGTLGSSAPSVIKTGDSERPFAVAGNTFADYDSAAQRSCNIQFDNCQRAANSGSSFSVSDCQDQQNDCLADPPAAEAGSSSVTAAEDDGSESGTTEPDRPEPDRTESESEPAPLAQTRIPYDSDYDIVCDL
ncbi:hypothetical protein ASPCAL11143 [Aspergillus calidoustus]|uniref:Uncharacterized protein n=1 Tax=Aspergillus calidoustus TaxID=454130 RepID=A0A0U4ZE11_ASPCI|nr:hypothetical protein ASPCAL11143 [Aspergillus calidoustus]